MITDHFSKLTKAVPTSEKGNAGKKFYQTEDCEFLYTNEAAGGKGAQFTPKFFAVRSTQLKKK